MDGINAYDILKLGVIGLGFLLALLAYRLLRAEQKRDTSRPAIIRSIYVFMGFSLLLCIVGFFSEFAKDSASTDETTLTELKTDNQTKTKEIETLKEQNSQYRVQLQSTMDTLNSLLEGKGAPLESYSNDDPIKKALVKIDDGLRKLAEKLAEEPSN
jgi:uncharacterized FlaG/YvyC family protein